MSTRISTSAIKAALTAALLAVAQNSFAQTVSAAPDSAPAPALVPASVPAKPSSSTGLFKHKKEEYTGPNEIVELPPTPMLDEEGKQRLDPDGKLMFNPPVKQQRDKKGHPLFDEKGKPVLQTATELGYDENGKKLRAEKVKPPKATPVSIVAGTYTVDGVIGKAALNYEIADFKYMYLFAPGIGTAVVSNEPFAGATEQKGAFNEGTLTVNIGDHVLQLASDKRLLNKKPESAYVLVDRQFLLPSRYPVIGYGLVTKAPYVWPGSKAQPVLEHALVQAPPPPTNLMPVLLLKPCPAGMMRMAGPKVLPGQVAPEQPCVAIARGPAIIVKGTTAAVANPAMTSSSEAAKPAVSATGASE